MGSPPPARGALALRAAEVIDREDHPRLRGEHPVWWQRDAFAPGSPPPARGALAALDRCDGVGGITPACAGSTAPSGTGPPCTWDHPRLRGEHGDVDLPHQVFDGSPPPARGAPPAYAPDTRPCASDHPRLRGEHAAQLGISKAALGSPPPARGALPQAARPTPVVGITPACAGSTSERRASRRCSSDHPRLRGEHLTTSSAEISAHGSPPPARGARQRQGVRQCPGGITPACAGSTRGPGRSAARLRDHPRLRGEHVQHRLERRAVERITPACAGSTSIRAGCRSSSADHPRLRGEHVGLRPPVPPASGSPPPARGALHGKLFRHQGRRITPACAGSTEIKERWQSEVYGSPPPARGAPYMEELWGITHRITPACAGSTDGGGGGHDARGSPPPARGAPRVAHRLPSRWRITPACAGSTSRGCPRRC